MLVSCYSASETSVEALDAILQLTSDFYGIALINARQIRAFLYVDGTNMPRCILRKAGIRPIPDPPEPLLLHEPEGSLWRLRCDLSIQLRREEKQTHPTRSGAVTIAPAVVVRTG